MGQKLFNVSDTNADVSYWCVALTPELAIDKVKLELEQDGLGELTGDDTKYEATQLEDDKAVTFMFEDDTMPDRLKKITLKASDWVCIYQNVQPGIIACTEW